MDVTWTKAQQAAMDTKDRLLLVSAAAGSGKTATLTERIIRRLTDPEAPAELSRMLIVTYTRAAAAELRTRISDALSKAIAAAPADRHLQKQLLDLSGAHICTIDSFCYDLVKPRFSALGLPAGFRIADEAELSPLSDRVMDDLFEKFFKKYAPRTASCGDDKSDRFALLRDNPFADLCDALSAGRTDDDLPDVLRGLYNQLLGYPRGIARLSDEAEAIRREADGELLQSSFGRLLHTWLKTYTTSAKAFYDEALAAVSACPDTDAACGRTLRAEADFVDALAAASSYEEVRALAASRKIPRITSRKAVPETFAPLLKKRDYYNTQQKDLLKDYFSDDTAKVREDLLRTARMCEVLADFLWAYDARMSAEKRQRGIVDFTDNRRNLLSLLQDANGRPTPLSADMRAAFDEVYIDEYQDVDEVQDTIFRLVGGDRRFMVGDIKQSIYSFRGAVPALFAGYRKAFFPLDPENKDALPDDDRGVCVFMSENFRCDEPVIRTANTVCGHLFRSCPGSVDYQPEDDLTFAKKVPEDAPMHKVQIDVLVKPGSGNTNNDTSDGDDAADSGSDKTGGKEPVPEFVHAANCIAGLLRRGERLDDGSPLCPEHICVLMRSKTHMGDLIAALRQAGVPAGAAELDSIQSSQDLLTGPDMIYLVDLLRVFDNPDSDGPLAEVLRAPFPGFTPDELVTVRSLSEGSLYEGLLACADGTTTGKGGLPPSALSEKAAEFVRWLEDYRLRCMSQSADAILRLMKQDAHVAARGSRAFLYLYDSVRTGRSGRFTGVYDFLRYFEKKIAAGKGAGGDAKQRRPGFVSVMTMHASKGLEFPVVFIVGTGNAFTSTKKPALLFGRICGAALKLYDRTDGRRYTSLPYALALNEKSVSEHEDEMRVLYVAMTRARERLYITGTVSESSGEPLPFPPEDRYAALTRSSYLSWIRSAAAFHPEFSAFADIHMIPAEAVEPCVPLDARASAADAAAADPTAAFYRSIADDMPVVTPEEALLRSIPTKVPASRMSDRLLDECVFLSSDLPVGDEDKLPDDAGFGVCDTATRESVARSISLMEKAGADELEYALRENRKPTAAEKGTAAHVFLQFCDYGRVVRDGVEAEMARLTAGGYLDERTASVADRAMLKRFFASGFFRTAVTAASVMREFRFSRFVPLAGLTADEDVRRAVGDRTLYVQGSIDLILRDADGRITLCDYKTDRVTREERADLSLLTSHLTERHGAQLRQYAEAVRGLFGRAPDRVCIFSLPLGEAVDITL